MPPGCRSATDAARVASDADRVDDEFARPAPTACASPSGSTASSATPAAQPRRSSSGSLTTIRPAPSRRATMHVSIPIVPAPSTTTVPGSASGLERNAWTHVATGSASTATSAARLIVDQVDARRRHRDELAEAAGAAAADELAVLADVLRPGAAARGRPGTAPAGSPPRGGRRAPRPPAAAVDHLADQLVTHDQRRRAARAPASRRPGRRCRRSRRAPRGSGLRSPAGTGASTSRTSSVRSSV